MGGRVVAASGHRRGVMRVCMGEVGLAAEVVKKVAGEIMAENEPPKKWSDSGLTNGWLALGVKHSRQLQFDEFALSQSEKGLAGKGVKLPRYNKSANAGVGDRADPSQWSKIEGPAQVVLFEGWMRGFEPQNKSEVAAVDPRLVLVNKQFAAYDDAWHKMIDSWIGIQDVDDPNRVFRWRLQAEVAMRADGKTGMTDEQVTSKPPLLQTAGG